MGENRLIRNSFVYLVILVAALALFYQYTQGPQTDEALTYSDVVNRALAGEVSEIEQTVNDSEIKITFDDSTTATIIKSDPDSNFRTELLQEAQARSETLLLTEPTNTTAAAAPINNVRDIDFTTKQSPAIGSFLATALTFLLPTLLLIGFLIFFMRQAQGSNNQAMSFGKSKARMFTGDKPSVTFADVAGQEEAKQDLTEVVEFLKFPEKFAQLGARIPRGVLMVGPPGTGKTLLSRAVAGEAGVPFFTISGSEFVEMFVGVGASVTGDTPILVRVDGEVKLLPIGEFVDQHYRHDTEGFVVPVESVETLGFEEKDSKFKGSSKLFIQGSAWQSVRGVFRHKVKEIYEIHYLGGVVRTTGDHSVFIRTRDGAKAIEARNIKPGDVLVNLPMKVRGEFSAEYGTSHSVRAHNFNELQEPMYVPVYEQDLQAHAQYTFALENKDTLSQRAIGEMIGVCQATVGHWQSGKHLPRSISDRYERTEVPELVEVTPDLMRLLGYYTAEGRENGCVQFTFGSHEPELYHDCAELLERIFNVPVKLEATPDNSTRVTVHSAVLGRFFERMCGTGSHNKHVPSLLWDLPYDYFAAYLRGYSDGDGYTTQEGKLSMTSVSQQLIRELTWLCALHGIQVGVREMVHPGGRVIKSKPLPETTAWNLIIGKTSHPFEDEVESPKQAKKPIVREVIVRPYDGYVYDLCGCGNEAFFGGEKPVLLHNSRVRDLFDQAKRNAPCIVFIDEIDAVGRQRGAGLGGSHDEREQTLNQILVEMDGFDTNTNVIVIAATNRPDVLDPALVRPGRFDRQVVLDAPDLRGRIEILKVHTKGKPLSEDVNLEAIAKLTPGSSGADLANIINEAAILAARRSKKRIGMSEMSDAAERIMLGGPERRSRMMTPKEKELTAYHEAGHAIVAKAMPGAHPVHKVTIIPRGMAGGYTLMIPENDQHYRSVSEFEAQIAVALGGRVAEEIVLGDFTTGASSDIQKITRMARAMVTRYGMSEKLGPIAFGEKEELVFLGREISEQRNYSDETAQLIDLEVRRIVDEGYKRVHKILERNRSVLNLMAEALIEHETLDGAALTELLNQVALYQSPNGEYSQKDIPASEM